MDILQRALIEVSRAILLEEESTISTMFMCTQSCKLFAFRCIYWKILNNLGSRSECSGDRTMDAIQRPT